MTDTIDFTAADLRTFSPRMQAGYRDALLAGKDALRATGILDNGKRLSHFFGQFGGETDGGVILRESLTYTTVGAIRGAWRSRASKHSDAWIKASLLRNPVALGDWAYGGRMGNRKGTSDGYDYRGGGFLQTTGRSAVEEYCRRCGLEMRPDILDDHAATLKFACAEWQASGCNALADANDLLGISKAINTGSATSSIIPNGMKNREAWFAKARDIWWDAEAGASVLPSPKEAHLGAHAALSESSTTYSLVGRGIQALRWLGPGGALGAAGKRAMDGGVTDAVNVTPVATDMLGQVGAAAHLIAKFGLPFLGIALAGVILLEGLRYLQRTYVVEVKP